MAERKEPKRKAVKPRRRRVTTAELSDRITGTTSKLDQLEARIAEIARAHGVTMGRLGDVEWIIEQAKGGRRERQD